MAVRVAGGLGGVLVAGGGAVGRPAGHLQPPHASCEEVSGGRAQREYGDPGDDFFVVWVELHGFGFACSVATRSARA